MPKPIKLEGSKTEDALKIVGDHMEAAVNLIRRKLGNLPALQAITFMFAGNPATIWGNENLLKTCAETAEAVRIDQLKLMRSVGCNGPEGIERLIGRERLVAQAADQAIQRFNGFIAKMSELKQRLEEEGDGNGTIQKAGR